MKSDYDVAVIGAGPAGLVAAKTAASQGLKVLLCESKQEVAKVRRSCCANLFLEPNIHSEFVTVKGENIIFHVNDFTVRYTGGWIELNENIRISPSGRRLTLSRKIDPIALSFNKEILLKDMLEDTLKCGVELKNNTLVTGVENCVDGVKVFMRREGKDCSIGASYVIAADGVNSRVVESLGYNKERQFFGTFNVISYIMEEVECPYPTAWLQFIGRGHLKGKSGQLYLNPKPPLRAEDPPQFELTCGCPVGASVKVAIDEFIQAGKFAPWFKKAKITETRSALLNFRTPICAPARGRVVIVGDAPAWIEVYIQGAIQYGYQGAMAIIKEMKGEDGINEYTRSWKDTFEYNLPGEIEKTTQVFGLHILEDEELDYLFGLTENDNIIGYLNEFTDPERVMGGILKHKDKIRKERPALAAKIEEFGKVSVKKALQVE